MASGSGGAAGDEGGGGDPGYDEFAMLQENTSEAGLAWSGPPIVRRQFADVSGGRRISALRWGTGEPQLVLLHGAAQNAHTWDTVALALGCPLLAIDLPGHGHSDWRADHDYAPATLAADVAVAVRAWSRLAPTVVGMSLGGLVALALAQAHPDLVGRLVMVDILPGTDAARIEPIVAFLGGPERFASFQAMLDRTARYSPNRPVSALRRGIRHNARQLADGSWTWRWDPIRWRQGGISEAADFSSLWSAIDAVQVPIMVVRGSASRMVGTDDISELLRRRPTARVVTVDGAGHNVQSDRPRELADRLAEFVTG